MRLSPIFFGDSRSVSLNPLRWKDRNILLLLRLGNVSIESKFCNYFFQKHLTKEIINVIIVKIIKLFALHTNLQYKLNRQERCSQSGHDSGSGILHPRDSSYKLLVSGVFLYTPETN